VGGSSSGGRAGSLGSGGATLGGGAGAGAGTSAGGSGGSSAGSGGSSAGSAGSGVSSGGTGSTLFFSDDFESAAVGGPPDTAKWSRFQLTGVAAVTAAATVDDSEHHGGGHSLKTVGVAGYSTYTAMKATAALSALNGKIFARMFIRFAAALPAAHTGFALLTDSSQAGKMLRIGGQNGVMQWNREDGDDTLPDQSPAGIAASYAPTANKWFCFEFSIDQTTGNLGAWVDGTAVSGMTNDGTPTQDLDARWLNKTGYKPNVQDISIGWQDYGGASMTLWFDDFALSSSRITCN